MRATTGSPGTAATYAAGAGVATALAAALAIAAARTAALWWGATPSRPDLLDEVILSAVCALGAAVALWYAASAALLTIGQIGALAPHSRRVVAAICAAWGAPGLRRLAAGAALASVSLSVGTTALASGTTPDDLGWASPRSASPAATAPQNSSPAATPAPPSPTAMTSTRTEAPAAEPVGKPSTATYTVRPTDSLWDIAARQLEPGATNAQIEAAWQRWYAANRDSLGPNPDLIYPGTILVPPLNDASKGLPK